ncbi:WXG100 family type VII secretion target [Catellatospora tritici]|uniref:WXG100 family type VII secretion target n=1 Tax=Catellatospora tritici TaxID=2851566 RepID=UPI001C2D5AAF|nr:hypothetical protein [Catellatospora tritici]MBV1853558.1 hypothetical protein [Catellatospora tritici]
MTADSGDPRAVAALAQTLRDVADLARDTAAAVDEAAGEEHWSGRAAQAYRTSVGRLPARLRQGADAFGEASAALADYAQALQRAQQGAARARELRRQSEATGVPDYSVAGAPPQDPEQAKAAAAAQQADRDAAALEQSTRAEFAEAVAAAVRQLKAAAAGAPRESILSWIEHQRLELWTGVAESVTGLLDLAVSSSRLGIVNAVLSPEDHARAVRGLREAVNAAVEHPDDFAVGVGKGVLDWDTWRHSPARAIGHLAPDAVAAVASGGAGASVAATRGSEVASRLDALDRVGHGWNAMTRGTTALERAGLGVADVATLSDSEAAAVLRRSEPMQPHSLNELGFKPPRDPNVIRPDVTDSFVDPAKIVEHPVVPKNMTMGSVYTDTGYASASYYGESRELLTMSSEAKYRTDYAIPHDWDTDAAGVVHPRDRMLVREFTAGDPMPMRSGGDGIIGQVSSSRVDATGALESYPGGAQQWVIGGGPGRDVPAMSWVGPPPWTRVSDPAVTAAGAATGGATFGAARADDVARDESR